MRCHSPSVTCMTTGYSWCTLSWRSSILFSRVFAIRVVHVSLGDGRRLIHGPRRRLELWSDCASFFLAGPPDAQRGRMLYSFLADGMATDFCPKEGRCASSPNPLPWWLHGIAQRKFPQVESASVGSRWYALENTAGFKARDAIIGLRVLVTRLVQASLSLLHRHGWRPRTSTLRRRMCAPRQCALTLVSSGPVHFRTLSTRWTCTTSRFKDQGPRTGFCWRSPGASWS